MLGTEIVYEGPNFKQMVKTGVGNAYFHCNAETSVLSQKYPRHGHEVLWRVVKEVWTPVVPNKWLLPMLHIQ